MQHVLVGSLWLPNNHHVRKVQEHVQQDLLAWFDHVAPSGSDGCSGTALAAGGDPARSQSVGARERSLAGLTDEIRAEDSMPSEVLGGTN